MPSGGNQGTKHTHIHTRLCNYIHAFPMFYVVRSETQQAEHTNTNIHTYTHAGVCIDIQCRYIAAPKGHTSHTCGQTHTQSHILAIRPEIKMADSLSVSCRQPWAQRRPSLQERTRRGEGMKREVMPSVLISALHVSSCHLPLSPHLLLAISGCLLLHPALPHHYWAA